MDNVKGFIEKNYDEMKNPPEQSSGVLNPDGNKKRYRTIDYGF